MFRFSFDSQINCVKEYFLFWVQEYLVSFWQCFLGKFVDMGKQIINVEEFLVRNLYECFIWFNNYFFNLFLYLNMGFMGCYFKISYNYIIIFNVLLVLKMEIKLIDI